MDFFGRMTTDIRSYEGGILRARNLTPVRQLRDGADVDSPREARESTREMGDGGWKRAKSPRFQHSLQNEHTPLPALLRIRIAGNLPVMNVEGVKATGDAPMEESKIMMYATILLLFDDTLCWIFGAGIGENVRFHLNETGCSPLTASCFPRLFRRSALRH